MGALGHAVSVLPPEGLGTEGQTCGWSSVSGAWRPVKTLQTKAQGAPLVGDTPSVLLGRAGAVLNSMGKDDQSSMRGAFLDSASCISARG